MGRIVLVANALHPKWGSEAGRAALWLKLALQSFEVEVITDSCVKDEIRGTIYEKAKFHFVEGMRFWNKLAVKTGLANIATKVFFFKAKRVLRQIGAGDFDVIHCITPAGIYAHNDFYKFGAPVIVGPLGGGLRTPQGFRRAFRYEWAKTILRDCFYWYVLRWGRGLKQYLSTASVVVVGLSAARECLPQDVDKKVTVIPDVLVDTDFFRPVYRTAEGGPVRVLFVGRLISNKGPLLLLDAIKMCLSNRVRDFLVEFVGVGLLGIQIENEINRHDLGRHARLVGGLPKEALRDKYQESDIFCLPTLREPGGTAILEAMSCGLPVITSDYGGPSVSVTDECGIRIKMTDYSTYTKDLADALRVLCSDRDLRRQMGEAGRRRAEEEYSVSALKRKIVELYSGVIAPQ